MAIFDLFSRRQQSKSASADVYVFDNIPAPLKVQICHIWVAALGKDPGGYYPANPTWELLSRAIAKEFGLFGLGSAREHITNYCNFFLSQATTLQALDMIEAAMRVKKHYKWQPGSEHGYEVEMSYDLAVEELNARFRQHRIGYAVVPGESKLVRIDNQHLHQEVILPALTLILEHNFEGVNDEYRRAHQHYRSGLYKECMTECAKAFESTLKTICKRKRWSYRETDTSSTLIETCLKNNLLPSYMQTHLGTVKSSLESAIPTLRNKLGAHGQGEQAKTIPAYYAEYLLHETATTIVFLVEAYKATCR